MIAVEEEEEEGSEVAAADIATSASEECEREW